MANIQVVTSAPPRVWASPYASWLKHPVECAVILALAPLWVALVALLALIMWIEGGQAFYVERRIGRYGRPFRCWKIRTLRLGSSRGCAASKQAPDPRAGRIGRFLRSSSLDELPQLINVLRGEMSLVGPRPVPAAELARFRALRQGYLRVRPGITGLWQVSGRNALPYSERIRLDQLYATTASLRLDLAIFARTFREILRLSGR